ncbi:MAG: hypothetical protein LBU84_18515 [Prevotella sp.]|jgi:hypothetical protein|nr:hypothetical protein [Prevotella sp.]
MKKFRAKRFLGGLVFLAVFAAAIAVVMLLWNALIPSIIGWTTINYWQAAGLMLLSRLLLGGFGHFGKFGGHRHFGKQKKEDFRQWHMMRDKMKDMSRDEKREYMRNHMREFRSGFCNDRKESKEDLNTTEE